jgi:hypothetical protein
VRIETVEGTKVRANRVPIPSWFSDPVVLEVSASQQGVWLLTRKGLALIRE